MANICVFSFSSEDVDEIYFKVARETGKLIGRRGYNLVYGGVDLGGMKEVAYGAREEGAEVIGILPLVFQNHPNRMNEAVFVDTLHHRKAEMEARSDAFIALPGGHGTLDELAGVIETRQVKAHDKPIVIANTNNFYRYLLAHFEHVYKNNFVRGGGNRKLYEVVNTPQEAIDYIEERLSRNS